MSAHDDFDDATYIAAQEAQMTGMDAETRPPEREASNVLPLRPAATSSKADAPTFLAPGAVARSLEEIEEALVLQPMFLSELLAIPEDEFVRVTPTLFNIISEDRSLLYRNRSNMIMGEAGKGKSLVLQAMIIEEARAKRHSLYIDLEKDFGAFVERMRDLGATPEDGLYIAYWKPRLTLPQVMKTIVAFVQTFGIDVVVLDTINRDLAKCGLDENNNTDMRTWYSLVNEPLLEVGATPVNVDHFKKPEEYRGSPQATKSRSPKGAVAKLEVMTGTVLAVETVTPFSRAQAGHSRTRVTKDNNGYWTEGEIAAEFHVTPEEGGRITTELRKSAVTTNDAGEFLPTVLMEKVSRYLGGLSEAVSMSTIKTAVGGNANWLGVAVERLVEAGFATQVEGPRKAKMISTAKPYRCEDESLNDGKPF